MKGKILLVEDEYQLVELYKEILGSAGFELRITGWAEEAVKILKTEPLPDLVLLDLVLPDKNGIYVLEEIRKDKNLKDLKVIVLTNYSNPLLENMCKKMNAPYVLKVDLLPKDLVKLVKEAVKSTQKKKPKKN
jgi:CheY-like chemotaxis protein